MAVEVEELVVRPGDHVVHFYEHDRNLIALAGDHLADGLRRGDTVVVIAVADHLAGLQKRITASGIDLRAARASGRFVSADSVEVLSRIAPGATPDRSAFDSIVGGLLRSAAGAGRPVRAYGDMVGVLWEAGRVDGAIALEELWNELAAELPFSLFCAYPGDDSVTEPDATRRVCGLHDVVVGVPAGAEQLARPQLLAKEIEQEFAAELDAPRAARRFAVDTVSEWGWAELVDTTELVVAELATNAVIHAKSRFVVTLTCRSTGIRAAVRDDSSAAAVARAPSMTAFSGRGLAIVDALATRWGVEERGDGPSGKVLWAEIEA